jgi:hypothetical protein
MLRLTFRFQHKAILDDQESLNIEKLQNVFFNSVGKLLMLGRQAQGKEWWKKI